MNKIIIIIAIIVLFVQSARGNTNTNNIVNIVKTNICIVPSNFYEVCRWDSSVTNNCSKLTLAPGRCEKDMGVIRSFDR